MSNCPGCGGIVGRDCWNPQECAWIMRDQAERYAALQYDPNPTPCQGCSEISGRITECLGICHGMRCEADLELRQRLWVEMGRAVADQSNPHAAAARAALNQEEA